MVIGLHSVVVLY